MMLLVGWGSAVVHTKYTLEIKILFTLRPAEIRERVEVASIILVSYCDRGASAASKHQSAVALPPSTYSESTSLPK